MNRLKWMLWIIPMTELAGQNSRTEIATVQVQPQVVGRPIREGQVTTVHLAPRYVTAIRMPEPINSVVLGDPVSFSAEHSDREPNLVFVKPITSRAAQSNLLVSSTRGLQTSVLLISAGDPKDQPQPAVDFLLRYRPPSQFTIQPTDSPSAMIPQTLPFASLANAPATVRTESVASASSGVTPNSLPNAGMSKHPEEGALNGLLERQRRAPLPVLYGQKPGISEPGKELVKTGISEVIDQGSEVVVLFSVVNVQDHAVELMAPQIQLGGKTKTGKIIRRSRWSTSEQLPVTDFRMSRRRLGPDDRADGVVVFKRPSFKQSTETLFLQMAESGAVDRPALAPIGFGISSIREVSYDAR